MDVDAGGHLALRVLEPKIEAHPHSRKPVFQEDRNRCLELCTQTRRRQRDWAKERKLRMLPLVSFETCRRTSFRHVLAGRNPCPSGGFCDLPINGRSPPSLLAKRYSLSFLPVLFCGTQKQDGQGYRRTVRRRGMNPQTRGFPELFGSNEHHFRRTGSSIVGLGRSA